MRHFVLWVYPYNRRELRAQESRDLPSKPEATAAIIAQNDSVFGASANGAIGTAVISAHR
jgi:hypothetical protein